MLWKAPCRCFLRIATPRRRRGRCLDLQAAGHCQQVCSPGFTSLKGGGVSSALASLQHLSYRRLKYPINCKALILLSWKPKISSGKGQLKNDIIVQSKQREQPQQKLSLQYFFIITSPSHQDSGLGPQPPSLLPPHGLESALTDLRKASCTHASVLPPPQVRETPHCRVVWY
jgi:hypothetical protein